MVMAAKDAIVRRVNAWNCKLFKMFASLIFNIHYMSTEFCLSSVIVIALPLEYIVRGLVLVKVASTDLNMKTRLMMCGNKSNLGIPWHFVQKLCSIPLIPLQVFLGYSTLPRASFIQEAQSPHSWHIYLQFYRRKEQVLRLPLQGTKEVVAARSQCVWKSTASAIRYISVTYHAF